MRVNSRPSTVQNRPTVGIVIESVLATVSGALLVLTLFWKDWIEAIFGVDPDAGSGQLEWMIGGLLIALTVTFSAFACGGWRRRGLTQREGCNR